MEDPPQQQGPFLDYVQLFLHLSQVAEMLCGQAQGVAERFCQEVALATQKRAQLLLRSQKPALSSLTASSASFPVQFRAHVYGTLYVTSNPTQPASSALPLPVAQLLARICGSTLYTLEISAFLQGQSQQSGYQAQKLFTKREQEVLALLYHRYDQEAIARELSITRKTVGKHLEHIYEKLGVHNEHDALLAAYSAGLFSPLEDFSR